MAAPRSRGQHPLGEALDLRRHGRIGRTGRVRFRRFLGKVGEVPSLGQGKYAQPQRIEGRIGHSNP